MKNLHKIAGIILCLFAGYQIVYSQIDSLRYLEIEAKLKKLEAEVKSVKPGVSSFLITGFTNLTYHHDLDNSNISRFDHAGFSPILLWKPSDKLFLETELHIEMEGGTHGGELAGGHGHGAAEEGGHEGSTHIDLGYVNMVYQINSFLSISAGKFLTPVGIYNERYHPTWINPLPIDPIGMGHGGPLPSAELGVQLRGGLQTGASKINYSVYLSNGPILNEGASSSADAGKLIYSNFSDNNTNKAIGGRLSWMPFSSSALEIGLSGQYAGKIGDAGTRYEDVSSSLYAVDLNYVKIISDLGMVRISGQFANVSVSDIDYLNSLEEIEAGEPVFFTFDNSSTFYYASASLRPIQHGKKFLRNSELIVRYENGVTPEESKWHSDESRILAGYTYWLQARSAVKLALSFEDTTVLYLQWAIGF